MVPSPNLEILELNGTTTIPRSFIGGKAYNLNMLKKHGFAIPASYALSTDAFSFVLDQHDIHTHITHLTFEDVEQKAAVLQQEFATIQLDELFQTVHTFIQEVYNTHHKNLFALRSSATLEDNAVNSFAGQFDSFLHIPLTTDALLTGIKSVYQSVFSFRALLYFVANEIDISKVAMGVVIQQMITPDFAGTVFTKDLENGDRDVLIIEATQGLGEGVVDGSATSSVYRIQKSSNKILDIQGAHILQKELIHSLAKTAKEIEAIYEKPQDIEWAMDQKGLWILQTRPITS